jgi:hypothetical protein
MKLGARWIKKGLLLATGTLGLAFAGQTGAQVQTTTTTTAGETRYNVTVNRGEVYAVDGNDLIVKMEDGTFRHFPDVPESARATVDGKQLGIHDLKPGMKLQRTITTTTTPQTITTIQTVTGKVWHVTPPTSVILTLENNTNQQFKIPRDQKFNVDGQMLDAFALKKGMQVTATKIVEVPAVVSTTQKSVTGKMPPPPVAPTAATTEPTSVPGSAPGSSTTATKPIAADAPLLIAEGEPTTVPAETESAPAPTEPTPAETESHTPWIWLGVVLLVIVFAVWYIRRSKSKK